MLPSRPPPSASNPEPVGWSSRNTSDRWIKAYLERGLDGLKPVLRADLNSVRRHPELFEEAARLRREQPRRSAAHIAEILLARHGVRISERTLREQLLRRGLDRGRLIGDVRVFGRYEAERPNERWIGDVLVGPHVPHPGVAGSKRARLFLLVDDHSRFLVHLGARAKASDRISFGLADRRPPLIQRTKRSP